VKARRPRKPQRTSARRKPQRAAAKRKQPRRRPVARARRRAAARPVEYSLLLTVTLCLLAFGVVMVFSASSTTSLLGETGDGAYYLKRTLIFGVVGLLVMRLLDVNGTRLLRPLTGVLLAASFVLLLAVHLPGVGMSVNGAQRWIGAGFIQIQPSELAKIALILYGANLLATRPKIVDNLRTLMPYLALVGAAALLIVTEPDLGTSLVLAGAVTVLLIAAGVQGKHLALLGGTLVFFGLMAIMVEPYRMERLTGFLNPADDPGGAGFQGIQASIAMGSGGIFGVGLGESVQKAFYLPEAHTDMIAAVIGEEVGLFGIAILIALFGLFGYAGFRTAQRCKDRYGKLLAVGLTGLILVQATINLFAVMGLAPLTGVPLPFVSYGNSSLLVTLACVGLLLNIASGRSQAARLRVVDGAKGRHSGGRDSRARRSGAGRGRRAAG
jgi:cell division protein FtsW